MKKTLLYAPMLYGGDVLSLPVTSDLSYYKWQRKLWNFLSKKNNWDIIWKSIPRSCHVEDPFQNKVSPNIRYSNKDLKMEMSQADLVYLDFPSTPLYDAKKMNKTVLCTVFNGKEYLRDNIDCIKIVNNEKEALECLDKVMSDKTYILKTKMFSNFILNEVDWKQIILGS